MASHAASQMKPKAPTMRKEILHPTRGSRRRPTSRGAMTAPMEAPPLKIAIPMARSFCGNHSAITFAAPGQLPASPRPRKKEQEEKLEKPVMAERAMAAAHQTMIERVKPGREP